MAAPRKKPVVLQDDLDAKRLKSYLGSRYLAVDTETLGLRVRRDRLCVVQLCNEKGLTTLVQIKKFQAPNLKRVLESPKVEKIFHFARFDLNALKQWLDCDVNPVFCTKIASRIARTYTSGHGLKDLSRELLGIDLDKQQQSSNWAAETLSAEQVAYAAADVTHLVAIKEKLVDMLQSQGRLELALNAISFLPHRSALDLAGWEEEDIFAHS